LTKDFIYLLIPFFFAILFVENTITLILETNTSETEGAVFEKSGVKDCIAGGDTITVINMF
jgi:hypothetical protein